MTIDPAHVRRTLLDLLLTPSFAKEERRVAELVRGRLEALGLRVECDDCHHTIGGDAGNLLCRVPGTVAAPTILLNSHLDTVDRTDGLTLVEDGDVVRTDGTTILGGDDKTGVAAILCGLEAALAAGVPRPPLEVLFTVQEEIGLCGAKALTPGWLQATLGFVFDHGVPMGELCVSAPGQTSHEIIFLGRAAHAGVEPEKGINAIACAASAINRTLQGRIDGETTCNIGVIQGGRATNIVPERCDVKAECRSRDRAKLHDRVAHLRGACEDAAAEFGCGLEFTTREAYRGFRIDRDEPVARLAQAAIEAAGLAPSWVDGGGGSDANIFNAAGIRCVVMPCGERDVHTKSEHVYVRDVVDAARVVANLIAAAAAGGQ
jgi:tripeptide aminopeptidase